MDAALDVAYDQEGVSAVICADEQGLCLGTRGEVDQSMASVISSMVSVGSGLSKSGAYPVLSIETESHIIHAKRNGKVTVAVFKAK